MSIISIEFLLFVAVCLISYYIVPKKHRWIVLLIFSYAFYSCANIKTIPYILITTLSTYLIARKLDTIGKDANRKKQKKLLVLLACLINFGMLFYFKYWNFFAEIINKVSNGERNPILSLILPLRNIFLYFSINRLCDWCL